APAAAPPVSVEKPVKPIQPAKAPPPHPQPLSAGVERGDEAPKSNPKPKKAGGLVSYLHTVIPKPVLFGFYGGMGGLLAVLLFGELFWLVLHPTPITLEPIRILAPAEVTVFPGSEN